MKAVVKSSIMTILVLIGIFSISASAQAFFSADQESADVFNRSVTQEPSQANVASWGYFSDADISRTAKIQPYAVSRIPDWNAEYGVEGHEAIQNQSQWVTKEPGQHGRWANGKQYDTNNKIPVDYPIRFLGWKSEHWLDEYKDVHYRGHGMPEEHGHNRHWVKRDADPSPTPIPSAALLLWSGLFIIGGLRARQEKREDPKEKVQEAWC